MSNPQKIGVIGLGYVGLPLAVAFFEAGRHVLGFEVPGDRLYAMLAGRSHVDAVPDAKLARMLSSTRFEITTDVRRYSEPDALLICVPTPLRCQEKASPDTRYLDVVFRDISDHARCGQVIVIESTVLPRTTEFYREHLEKNGLKVGRDIYLAHSPEREDPGNTQFKNTLVSKLLGGVDPESAEAARLVYEAVFPVVVVSSARVAEAAKLLENTYRLVNIALINELNLLFRELRLDTQEIISAAATKPFGFQPFYPGPGIGGPCIGENPRSLSWYAKVLTGCRLPLIDAAGEYVHKIPAEVVRVLQTALSRRGECLDGSKVLVIGMTYKRDVADTRGSPGAAITKRLIAAGAEVHWYDEKVAADFSPHHAAIRITSFWELLQQDFRAVVITVDDSIYSRKLEAIVRNSRLVLDTRNATRDITEKENVIMV